MQKKDYSWGIIIFMFFLFFPVGIWMLIRKINGERLSYSKIGKSLKIVGWILLSFAFIYLMMGITGELEMEDGSSTVGSVLTSLLIFGGGGYLCLKKSTIYLQRGTKYNKYLSIVNTSNDLSIDRIAAAYPTTFEEAVADLQAMIDDGYFTNSYIDSNRRELVMPKNTTSTHTDSNPMFFEQTATTEQLRISNCPNCGAPNTNTAGLVVECEYCGSMLKL